MKTILQVRGVWLPILSVGLLLAACGSGPATTASTTTPQPTKLNGQQEYKSAQELADELTKLGHRCDMTGTSGGYFDESGRCYLGGSSGPGVVLIIYSSQSQIEKYFTEVPVEHAWLFGKNWGINCHDGEPTLCNELQAQLGGDINRAADTPPTTPTKMPPPMSADDREIANTAKRWLLEGWMLPADGGFKSMPCTDDEARVCWASYINNIAFSNGVLYLEMDTDWTQQPDGSRNDSAQNRVARLFELGPGPRLVMDNVKNVQSVDRNGVVRSSAPLK